MSNFTPQVPYNTTFEGDTVTMNLLRLKRKAMMKLTPYVTQDGEGAIDNMALMNVAADLLPEHVKNFAGLKTADGIELTIEGVVEEAYFMNLMSSIIARLFEISKMSEAEEGNSEEQPNTSIGTLEISEGNS